MEQILRTLQDIQLEALRMHCAIFYITVFHWDDECSDAIVVRACKTDGDDDVFYGRFCSDNLDDAQAIITHLKIYLGI